MHENMISAIQKSIIGVIRLLSPRAEKSDYSKKVMNDSVCKVTQKLAEGKPRLNHLSTLHGCEGRTLAIDSGPLRHISLRSVRSVRSLSSVVILRSLRSPLFFARALCPFGTGAHVR